MHPFQGFTDSPMWRRFAATVAACALLPLLLIGLLGARELGERDRRGAALEMATRAEAFAGVVAARLSAADAVARSLGERAGAGDGLATLQSAALSSGIFSRVLIGESVAGLPGPLLPAVAPRTANRSGSSSLVTLEARVGQGSVYLVRDLRVDGRDVQAYFELAPDWLWQDAWASAGASIVVDGRATVLFHPEGFPTHGASVLRAAVLSGGAVGAVPGARATGLPAAAAGTLSWQAGGREWRGALVPLHLPGSIQVESPWRVAAAGAVVGNFAATQPLHGAALFGQTKMVSWLLEHDATPYVKDYEGKTPLDRARENQHPDVVALLEPYFEAAD
jgi:hypothetical protein